MAPAVAAAPAPEAAPYSISATTVPMASTPGLSRSYAGFWIRFLAVVLDSFIVGAVTGPLMILVQLATGFNSMIQPGSSGPNLAMLAVTIAAMMTISVAANAIYEAWLTSSSKQATVGKMVFRIKVTDLDGNRITFGRALGRHFAKFLSSLTFGIGYLMQPFTQKKQALHDMVAGTLIVRESGVPYQVVPPQQPATF